MTIDYIHSLKVTSLILILANAIGDQNVSVPGSLFSLISRLKRHFVKGIAQV